MPVSDQLVKNGALAADAIVIGFQGTGAELTRATIKRALEALEANGMIKVIHEAEWPELFVADPPYEDLLKRTDEITINYA